MKVINEMKLVIEIVNEIESSMDVCTSRRGWRLPPSEFRQVSCLVITVFPGGQMTSNHFLGILVRMDRLDDHHTNTSRSNFWKFLRGGLRLPGRSDDLQESDIQQGGQLTPGKSDDLQRSYCPAAQSKHKKQSKKLGAL